MTARQCPDPAKNAYPSRRQATKALRKIRHPLGRMQVYRCGSHWHFGHGERSKHFQARHQGSKR